MSERASRDRRTSSRARRSNKVRPRFHGRAAAVGARRRIGPTPSSAKLLRAARAEGAHLQAWRTATNNELLRGAAS